MAGRILKVAYGLRYHYLGSWALSRWLVFLCLGAAVFWLLRARFVLTATVWPVVVLLLLIALAMPAVERWGQRRSFLQFVPESQALTPMPVAMDPLDKILVHATGEFEVEGKSHFFADLLAYWRTFGSREHAIMAIVHPSRYLLVGQMPEHDIGMWYIFFRPEMVRRIEPGHVRTGNACRLALYIRYERPAESSNSKRRLWQRGRRPATRSDVYLTFDEPTARQKLWADILAGTEPQGDVRRR